MPTARGIVKRGKPTARGAKRIVKRAAVDDPLVRGAVARAKRDGILARAKEIIDGLLSPPSRRSGTPSRRGRGA